MYRCEASSVAGFIQQLAVSYVTNGYWFYVTGEIPAHKDPRAVDAKLIARYGLDVSKWTRCRRRKAGGASVQYLRHGHFFVIVATRGEHEFFTAEASRIRDIRRVPLRYASYAVGCVLSQCEQSLINWFVSEPTSGSTPHKAAALPSAFIPRPTWAGSPAGNFGYWMLGRS